MSLIKIGSSAVCKIEPFTEMAGDSPSRSRSVFYFFISDCNFAFAWRVCPLDGSSNCDLRRLAVYRIAVHLTRSRAVRVSVCNISFCNISFTSTTPFDVAISVIDISCVHRGQHSISVSNTMMPNGVGCSPARPIDHLSDWSELTSRFWPFD